MKKLGFRGVREFIQNNIEEHNMTLSESVVDFFESHDIPLDKIKQYLDPGLLETLTAELNINKNDTNINIYSFITKSKCKDKKLKNIKRIKR